MLLFAPPQLIKSIVLQSIQFHGRQCDYANLEAKCHIYPCTTASGRGKVTPTFRYLKFLSKRGNFMHGNDYVKLKVWGADSLKMIFSGQK